MYSRLLATFLTATLAFNVMAQELKTDKDRTSYAVGVQMGKALSSGKDLIDMDIFVEGMKDVFEDGDVQLNDAEVMTLIQKWQQEAQEQAAATQGKEGTEFLEANGKKEGVVTLPSGLQYEILKPGTGATPTRNDTVKAHYRGTLINGKQFDSSYDRGTPFEAPVTGVIPGWTEALLLMKVGEKRRLFIPQDLAYGARGAGADIPPFSTLIFEMELLDIIK